MTYSSDDRSDLTPEERGRKWIEDNVESYRSGLYTCRNCESKVSKEFGEVFGNNNDEVFKCLECSTSREVKDAAAYRPSS